jgi:hypothetical protein
MTPLFVWALRPNPLGSLKTGSSHDRESIGGFLCLKTAGDLPAALGQFQHELLLNPAHQAAAQQAAEIQQQLTAK